MDILQKICRLYCQADGKIGGYPLMDMPLLEEVIYEFSEFLTNQIEKGNFIFIGRYSKLKRMAGIESVKSAIECLEEAKYKKTVFKKMALFDEAKHWIHKAGVFGGELGRMHKEFRRRQRLGWHVPLLT